MKRATRGKVTSTTRRYVLADQRTRATMPPPPVVIPGKDPWWRSILTDHNGDFDMGAVLVGVVTIAMCIISGYDVMYNHVKFNPQEFGTGVGAVLVGFAAYKWGDAKRAPSTTTTTAIISTEGKP